MGTPTYQLVFDRRKRASAKKEGSIELRITYNRKQRFVATGVRCLPKHWRNGSVVNCLDAYERQHTLDMFVAHARKVINEAMERGELDMDGIVAQIGGSQRKAATENVPTERLLVDFFRERAEIRKYGKAKDSQERYDRFIRWFEAWGKMVRWSRVISILLFFCSFGISSYLCGRNSGIFSNFVVQRYDVFSY